MIQLTQGMYTDLTCHTFGLSYAQQRHNEVIRNAGWFNLNGDKLGYGDLSISDIDCISLHIPSRELFVVLSEGDSVWNMPTSLNRMAPGIDYVLRHAKWVVSGFLGSQGEIFNIRDEVVINGIGYQSDAYNRIFDSKNNFEYSEVTRDKLYSILGYSNGAFANQLKPVNNFLKIGAYYGLDVYEYHDGTEWAIGTSTTVFNAASKKLRENLHLANLEKLRYYFNFNAFEIDILNDMADKYGPDSSNILKALLGTNLDEFVVREISNQGFGPILASYDSLECKSDLIAGLPPGYYAYRIG